MNLFKIIFSHLRRPFVKPENLVDLSVLDKIEKAEIDSAEKAADKTAAEQ